MTGIDWLAFSFGEEGLGQITHLALPLPPAPVRSGFSRPAEEGRDNPPLRFSLRDPGRNWSSTILSRPRSRVG